MTIRFVIYVAREITGLACVAASIGAKDAAGPLWFLAGVGCFALAQYGWNSTKETT